MMMMMMTVRGNHANIFHVTSVSGRWATERHGASKLWCDSRNDNKPWWRLDRLHGPHWPSSVRPSVRLLHHQPASSIISVILIEMRSNHRASAADVWWL